MANKTNSIHCYANPKLNLNAEGFRPYHRGGISCTTNYYNNLMHDVIVSTQNGLQFTVAPRKHYDDDFDFNCNHGFIVEYELVIPAANITEVKDFLNQKNLDPKIQADLVMIAEACRNFIANPVHGRFCDDCVRISIAYFLDHRLFQKYSNEAIYIEDLNLLVQRAGGKEIQPHPLSTPELKKAWINSIESNPADWSFGIEMNDHSGDVAPKFINVNGHVEKIFPSYDKTRPEGIFTRMVNKGNSAEQVINKSYELTEWKEAGLYATHEEALTGGNAKLLHELKLKEAEERVLKLAAENAAKSQQLKGEEFDYKRALLKREEEISHLQHTLEQVKLDAAQMKAEADKIKSIRDDFFAQQEAYRKAKGDDRRDASEFMRWAPGIMVGIIGITVGIIKSMAAEKLVGALVLA